MLLVREATDVSAVASPVVRMAMAGRDSMLIETLSGTKKLESYREQISICQSFVKKPLCIDCLPAGTNCPSLMQLHRW